MKILYYDVVEPSMPEIDILHCSEFDHSKTLNYNKWNLFKDNNSEIKLKLSIYDDLDNFCYANEELEYLLEASEHIEIASGGHYVISSKVDLELITGRL